MACPRLCTRGGTDPARKKMPPENRSISEALRVLIVDDDPGQRSLLDSFLRAQGFVTILAASGQEGLGLLRQHQVNAIVSDVRMPGLSGLETLRKVRQEYPVLPVLLVTAYADIREAVGAMRDGAVSYLAKPIDLDELLQILRDATGTEDAGSPKPRIKLQLPEHVVAESPRMRAVFQEASLIAPSESRVLITGESGAGKEVLAEVVHAWSPRALGPMIKVNCAAIPENLLESELFGHEKGSFTGAVAQRIGRFEQANGGTIFLDEVADMSPPLQAKLLRVTQEGRFNRVGSNREITTDARILAATNRNLEEEVTAGRFREDLFYRLNVVELHIPPLRERIEDILPLARAFVAKFTGGRARFSAGVIEVLNRYSWPGNVRELRNAMERATLLCQGDLILSEHLPARIRGSPQLDPQPQEAPQEQQLDDIERQAIFQSLREHRYNRTETAKALGISRRALIYKLQRYRSLGHNVDVGA